MAGGKAAGVERLLGDNGLPGAVERYCTEVKTMLAGAGLDGVVTIVNVRNTSAGTSVVLTPESYSDEDTRARLFEAGKRRGVPWSVIVSKEELPLGPGSSITEPRHTLVFVRHPLAIGPRATWRTVCYLLGSVTGLGISLLALTVVASGL